jgi:hypothetical protein
MIYYLPKIRKQNAFNLKSVTVQSPGKLDAAATLNYATVLWIPLDPEFPCFAQVLPFSAHAAEK